VRNADTNLMMVDWPKGWQD